MLCRCARLLLLAASSGNSNPTGDYSQHRTDAKTWAISARDCRDWLIDWLTDQPIDRWNARCRVTNTLCWVRSCSSCPGSHVNLTGSRMHLPPRLSRLADISTSLIIHTHDKCGANDLSAAALNSAPIPATLTLNTGPPDPRHEVSPLFFRGWTLPPSSAVRHFVRIRGWTNDGGMTMNHDNDHTRVFEKFATWVEKAWNFGEILVWVGRATLLMYWVPTNFRRLSDFAIFL